MAVDSQSIDGRTARAPLRFTDNLCFGIPMANYMMSCYTRVDDSNELLILHTPRLRLPSVPRGPCPHLRNCAFCLSGATPLLVPCHLWVYKGGCRTSASPSSPPVTQLGTNLKAIQPVVLNVERSTLILHSLWIRSPNPRRLSSPLSMQVIFADLLLCSWISYITIFPGASRLSPRSPTRSQSKDRSIQRSP